MRCLPWIVSLILSGCLARPSPEMVGPAGYHAHASLLGPLIYEQELSVSLAERPSEPGPSLRVRRDWRLGPFGCLATIRESPGRSDLSLISIPLLGLSLFDITIRTDRTRARLGLVPYIPLVSWERTPISHRAGIGPWRLLLDVGWGPDRARLSLTPLFRYDRHGQATRLRVLFLDVYRSEPSR